jgi:uncharacterized membrane protein
MDAPPTAQPQPTVGQNPLLIERMLFFSDAVFAIVLTLLALDLKPPAGVDAAHLLAGLYAMRGDLISFAVTFALVGVFWMAHLVSLRALATFDWMVAGVNLLFLFTVTMTPFVSSLVGKFGTDSDAWRLYCLTIIAISLAQAALLVVSHRDEPRILRQEHHGRLWFRLARASTPGVAFAFGLALSLAGLRAPAGFCWMLVPVLMLLVRRLGAEPASSPPKREPA